MKGNLLIKGANYINAQKGRIEAADILFTRDPSPRVIIGKNDKRSFKDGTTVIMADGEYIAPAFCDLRCNIGDISRRGGSPDVSCAIAGGYGIICPTPLGTSAEYPETPAMYTKYKEKLSAKKEINAIAVSPVVKKHLSASICDIEGMASNGARVFTDRTPSGYLDNATMQRIMKSIAQVDGLLICSVHDRRMALDGTVNEGRIARMTGEKGIPASSELLAVMRSIILSRETGCRVHISGISLGYSVKMIAGAKAEGVKVTCSVSPPYFSYTEDEIIYRGAMAKLMPPLRSADDMEMIVQGLADGTVDCIESDHMPVSASAKKDLKTGDFGSMGFETTFSAGLTKLVKTGRISIFRLIQLMSIRPFEILYGKSFEDSDLATTGVVKLDLHTGSIYSKQKALLAGRVSVFDGAFLYGEVERMGL